MEGYYVIVQVSEKCFTREVTSCTVTDRANTHVQLSKALGSTAAVERVVKEQGEHPLVPNLHLAAELPTGAPFSLSTLPNSAMAQDEPSVGRQPLSLWLRLQPEQRQWKPPPPLSATTPPPAPAP